LLLEYNIIHHLEDGTTDEGLLQVGVRQSHLVEQTRQNFTTRKVAICDDLLVTLLTFVTEWYVLYDEFSNFVIGGK
jgi:hypothetical protein